MGVEGERMSLMTWSYLLIGCDIVDQVKDVADAVNGLTNPLVAQGIVLSVQDPGDPTVQTALSAAGTEIGTSATIFLADAASAADLANAPVLGATVVLDGTSAIDNGDGSYLIAPSVGLTYAVGESWTTTIIPTPDAGESLATVTLPEAAVIEWPETIVTGEAWSFSLEDQGFDGVVLVVLDIDGAPTYSNEPKSVGDLYNATASGEPLTVVEIPASAFPADGVYIIGVAGLVGTTAADLFEVNTALSNVSAGQMLFRAVTALPGS